LLVFSTDAILVSSVGLFSAAGLTIVNAQLLSCDMISHNNSLQVVYTHVYSTNLATGVSRQSVLDCGTIFHPDCGIRDFPSILSDDL